MGTNTIKINNIVYDLTTEIHRALSSTGYDGKNTKQESDFILLNNNMKNIGYTVVGDKKSKHQSFLIGLLLKVAEIKGEESDYLRI